MRILAIEHETPGAPAAAFGTLPLVRAGLIAFEIIPLIPYPGFARLFEPERSE